MEEDTEPARKVRLVRCPNCKLLLPEPEDVLVYKCGGCDTILQAKRRYNEARRRVAALHGTEAEQMNGADSVSEVQNSVGSSQRVSCSSSSERSLEQNTARGGDVRGDSGSQRIGGGNSSNEDQNEARNHHIDQPGSTSELAHCAELNGVDSEVEEDDESLKLIRRAKPSADAVDETLSSAETSVVGGSNAESSAAAIGNDDLIVADDRLARDSFSSDVVVSSPDEQRVSDDRLPRDSFSSDIVVSSPDERREQPRWISSNDENRFSSDVVVSSPDEQREQLRWVSSNDAKHDESDLVSGKLNTENSATIDGDHSTLTFHKPADESDSSGVIASYSDEQVEQQSSGYDHSVPNGTSEDSAHLAEAKPEVDVENRHERGDSASRSSNAGDAFFIRENNSAVVSSPDEQKQFQETSEDDRPNNAFVANSEGSDNDQSLQLVEAKSAFEVSKFRRFDGENTPVSTNDASDMVGGKTVASEVLVSSPDIPRKPRFGASSKHDFNRVRSQDTFDSAGFFSPSSELSMIDYAYKSPTTRSAHAYDGSVSSFDGIDDLVPDQQYVNPNKFSSKLPLYGKAETRHHVRNLSLVKGDNDELLDNTRYDLHDRNVTRFERDDLQSLARLYQRDYQAGYESGGASSYPQDEFSNHSNEQEKIRLLRMVYELQDQLKRTSYMNKMGSYRVPSEAIAKDKYVPSYYSREMTDEDISRDLNFRRYPEKHRQESGWFNQHKYSGIPFSGEAPNSRIDSSCSHCCQFSAQLPPPIRSHSRRFCTSHAGHSCCRSCPSSPQQFTDSEYPVAYRETKSDDQRHEENNAKRRTMEKANLAKRHLRPTAGAAPFVICYHCLKSLQLPADFLLFKRKFHQLKCGACSEVLKFSLQDRIHLVPYNPEAEAAAPMDRTIPSSCNSNEYPLAEPVSCSDDYGLSHHNSNSTDTDPVLFTPFRNVQANNVPGRSMLSDPPTREGNHLVRKQFQSKKKNPSERFEPAESSSQRSRSGRILTEIKQLALKSGSPLHQLMGYNSPSQVFRGSHNPSSSSASSFYS